MSQNGLPNNLHAEEAALGCCLLGNPAVIDGVAELLKDGAWYNPRNRQVWQAICALRERGESVDQGMVWSELELRGAGQEVPAAYVAGLMRETATDRNALSYARIVLDCWRRRQAIVAAQQLEERAKDMLEDADGVLSDFLRVPEMVAGKGQAEYMPVSGPLDEGMRLVQTVIDNPRALQGVPTGLCTLDDVLDGWQAGELILVAGRPSMGKTAIGLHFARHAADHVAVLVVSAEMRAQAIALRLIASESKLDSHNLRRGRISVADVEAAKIRTEALASLRFYIADRIFDIKTLVLEARRAKREHGIGLLIVDYLQLLRPAEKLDSREREVASIGRDLKRLAVELDVPVIAMAQLSRAVETRAEKRPQMSDLRESGALEQDADVVILLYRPGAYDDSEATDKTLLELIIAKHRNGPIGTIDAYYDLSSGFIAPMSHREGY